jgi:hypothetical protein
MQDLISEGIARLGWASWQIFVKPSKLIEGEG